MSVFADPVTNYTAGYVTSLWLWSFAEPVLGLVWTIKMSALTGTALCALAFHSVLKALEVDAEHRLFGTLLMLALPTVALNGAALAQADAFYTAFVLWSLACVLRGRLIWAGIAFAVAISFKLQAIFFAPFLAGVMLRDPRAVIVSAIALVPTYLAVNTLYLAGGRPVTEVLMIYADQGGYYRDIWKGAANLWWPVHATLTPEDLARHYDSFVRIGLALTVTVGLAILAATRRTGPVTPRTRDALLKLATISAAAVPFVLPKMHDRYFFMAEVMVLLLALTNRRYWPAVLLMQGSGALAYCGHEDILGFK
ncbi:MAG: glycosyltransferase 87 family protein, partial [Pseudomonadota bacterium]